MPYRRHGISVFGLLYLIIGIFVAWHHDYLNTALLKAVGSALLAIFLWWLILLGANLHIHG